MPKRGFHMRKLLCAGCGADTDARPIRHNAHCPRMNGDLPPAEKFERSVQVASLPKSFGAVPDWRNV